MKLCAITDRQRLLPAAGASLEAEADRRRLLRALLRDWFQGGVDFVQLREKDLNLDGLLALAGELLADLDRGQTKILINLPASSLAAPEKSIARLLQLCDGIHLPGKAVIEDGKMVRETFRRHAREALVSMSCHSLEEILAARAGGADLVFYAPVFEKLASGGDAGAAGRKGQGLAALARACETAGGMPVFALGGVTVANAADCIAAGSAGVAGIRLFEQREWRQLSRQRESAPKQAASCN